MAKVLSDRALALYKYLLESKRAFLGEIMEDLDNYYKRSEERTDKHNSSALRKLRKDVVEVNDSNSQHAIIPIKENGKTVGYRLADSNEAILERADNYHQRALRMLRKEYALRKKARNNAQLRMTRDGVTVIRSVVKDNEL